MVPKRRFKLKQPTMRDVAEMAGVSQPTVSRVLNQNDTSISISDETRQRVQAAIAKLGYRPNFVARSLRTQRTQTIALLIADLSNGFYHPMERAIQDIARQRGYEVFISNSDHLYANEKHFCEMVSRGGFDGVIMVPIHVTAAELDQFFTQRNIPAVVLGEHFQHPNIDVVYVDDERAIYETTHWLIAAGGHQKIGFIGVPEELPPGPRRLRGFKRAMSEAGIEIVPRFIVQGDFTLEGGGRAARSLIENGELPTALIALNDLMAIGAILAFQDAGYAVPEDIAVVGFDDIPEAKIIRPMLTTIAQDPRDIGQKLANALFERFENPNITEKRVFESTYQLMVRGST